MAKHEQSFDPKDRHSILEAGNNLRCHHIAGNSCDKDVANCLIKDQFHRDARIGTGEYRGKGLLLIDGMFFQDGQIVLNRGQLICNETLVACKQFVQSSIGTQIGLGVKLLRRSQFDSGLHRDSNDRT